MNFSQKYSLLYKNQRRLKRFSFRFLMIPALLFITHSKVFSNENDSTVTHIFTLIYNQQFTEAEKALESNRTQIEPFYHNILKLDLFWWKYSLSKSKEDSKAFNNVLEEFDKSSQNTIEDRINNLIRSSYQMRYEVKRYNLIGALIIRSAVRDQIEELENEDLSFLGDRQKLFDLQIVLFNFFEESINPFSFGKKSDGYLKSLSVLEKYSLEDDFILSTMAHYFLGRIYTKMEKQPEKGKTHFMILSKRFPKNVLFYELANGLNPKF